MDLSNENLKAAITTIQDTARLGDKPHIEEVVLFDQKGGRHTVPVAFVADGPGKVRAVHLLDVQQAALRHADSLRLGAAAGPDRRKGTAFHQTLDSFVAHANRFKDEGTVVWAHAVGQNVKLVTVFNYHHTNHNGVPRWGDHRAEYPCPLSDAWTTWGAGTAIELCQEELADFLEARDFDLANGTLKSGTNAPTPAMLVTIANRLETFSETKTKRERDANTGRAKLVYSAESGVTGDVMPPPCFLISIPVFTDSPPVTMEVRLRVKVEDGRARFTLQIHDADAVWRKAMDVLQMDVINGTALPVYQGTPE